MRELILLGTAPSRSLCPFDCETWGVCGVYTIEKINVIEKKPFRLDKLFITDTTFSPEGNLHWDINELHRIKKKYGTEIITLNPIGFGRMKLKSTQYPYDDFVEEFQTEYFTDSVTYMIAYALHLNVYDKFRFYGIDMASKIEYLTQKGGVEYWIGRAHERGIKTDISKGSALLRTSTVTPYGRKKEYDMSLLDPEGLMDKK